VNLAVQVALIASVFIVAAGVLGISWANARNSQKTQIESLYEKENKALGLALDRSERRVVQLELALEKAVDKAAVLEQTVSGTDEVKKLRLDMAAQEQKRGEEHGAMMMLLKDLIAQWRNKRGEIQ
jgi:hypothetical protein